MPFLYFKKCTSPQKKRNNNSGKLSSKEAKQTVPKFGSILLCQMPRMFPCLWETLHQSTRRTNSMKWRKTIVLLCSKSNGLRLTIRPVWGVNFFEFVAMLKHCLARVSAAQRRSRKIMYCPQIANVTRNQAIKHAHELDNMEELEADGIIVFLRRIHSTCFSTLVDGFLKITGKPRPCLYQKTMFCTDQF
jgi:hypothetical protein